MRLNVRRRDSVSKGSGDAERYFREANKGIKIKKSTDVKRAAGIKSKITAKQRIARQKNIEIARRSRRKAGLAFKEEFERSRKINNLDEARRKGHIAAMKANMAKGSKMVRKYFTAVGRNQSRTIGLENRKREGRYLAKKVIKYIARDIKRSK